jgi:hypothetical protein
MHFVPLTEDHGFRYLVQRPSCFMTVAAQQQESFVLTDVVCMR